MFKTSRLVAAELKQETGSNVWLSTRTDVFLLSVCPQGPPVHHPQGFLLQPNPDSNPARSDQNPLRFLQPSSGSSAQETVYTPGPGAAQTDPNQQPKPWTSLRLPVTPPPGDHAPPDPASSDRRHVGRRTSLQDSLTLLTLWAPDWRSFMSSGFHLIIMRIYRHIKQNNYLFKTNFYTFREL